MKNRETYVVAICNEYKNINSTLGESTDHMKTIHALRKLITFAERFFTISLDHDERVVDSVQMVTNKLRRHVSELEYSISNES